MKLESGTLDRVKCALKNGAIEGFHETFTTQWTKLIPQNGQVGVELRARLCEVSGARSNNSPIKLLVTRAGIGKWLRPLLRAALIADLLDRICS